MSEGIFTFMQLGDGLRMADRGGPKHGTRGHDTCSRRQVYASASGAAGNHVFGVVFIELLMRFFLIQYV